MQQQQADQQHHQHQEGGQQQVEEQLEQGGEPNFNGEFFNVLDERETKYPRFPICAREIVLKFKNNNITGDVISDSNSCIENLFSYIAREYDSEDDIGISISTVTLSLGPVYSFKILKIHSVQEMWELISDVSQSEREFKIENIFIIKITRGRAPVDFGCSSIDSNNSLINSESIVKISCRYFTR